MSALGQKRTYAVQQAMSALHPIATAKADMRANWSAYCPDLKRPLVIVLNQLRTGNAARACDPQKVMSALG